MCPLRVILLCPLRVILLWTLLCPGTGKVPEEIFTRPGSDLLIPIRIHLTLNHTDRWECDRIYWYYEKSPGDWERIAEHRNCDPSIFRYFPNTRISENGSLIISNVTPENDGMYRVYIENSTGHRIQRDDYFIHVEGKVQEIFTRPGSDLLIPIRIHLTLNPTDTGRCDRIYWYYEKFPGDWEEIAYHWDCDPSDVRYFPNTRISENGSLIISNVTPENDGRYRVYIENSTGRLIQRDDYFIHVEEIRSCWGHFLSSGAVFVLYTGLLIFMVNDLRKMKNEKNEKSRSERRMRRRDPMEVEMEMEPTYYNEGT
ncbi:uncharacterized protein LOC143959454 [Lithobates pipiens]